MAARRPLVNVSGAVQEKADTDTIVGLVIGTDVAALASPTFTGTPAAPTAAVGTNTTQVATTAFVAAGGHGNAIYGDGSDGTVTISGTTTLARDMFYDVLTVQNGGTLKTNGYRVFCKTSCTVDTGGVIHADGNAASGVTGATAAAAGSIAGTAGGPGGGTTTGNAASGFATTNALGGAGGAGGAGSSGAGGAGAAVSAPAAASGPTHGLAAAEWGRAANSTSFVQLSGGEPGGGGGGNGTTAGGGGGGGGGLLILIAAAITNNGTIRAAGGAGGTPVGSNCGGGGGGGGGMIYLVYNTFTGTATAATAGAGGGATGSGVAGSAGSVGRVIALTNA